jgi:hypothetical protein
MGTAEKNRIWRENHREYHRAYMKRLRSQETPLEREKRLLIQKLKYNGQKRKDNKQ